MAKPHPEIHKAVKRLQRVYIHATPFYSEDGTAVRVDIQDVKNGVPQEPFVLAIEVDDTKPAGLLIRRSGVTWTQSAELTPGILIPSDKAWKAREKAERAAAPYLSDKFTIRDNPNPQMDQQFSYDEVVKMPPQQVWTVVEGDSGKLWAVTGVHFVNRLHYVVTEEPWKEEDEGIDYKW